MTVFRDGPFDGDYENMVEEASEFGTATIFFFFFLH